eukprot:9934702-Ditylum_brightwellii.AAC.1
MTKVTLLILIWLQQTCNAFVPSKIDSARTHQCSTATPEDNQISNFDIINHRDEYDGHSWTQCFQTVEQESAYELDGDFPDDLVGTFFQNGYTKFYISEDEFHIHPFDADGMVQAVTFPRNGKPWFRNRYVQTPGYLQELQAKKVCKRGVYGTAKNKGKWYSNMFDLDFKNAANTHVLFIGEGEKEHKDKAELYALWEAGRPFEMDPTTLETIQESSLYGAVDIDNKGCYAAHYKVDPNSGNICGFAIMPGDKNPINTHKLTVMEHNDRKLLYKKSYPFDGLGVKHDCAITKHYFVFAQPPCQFNPIPFIAGFKGAFDCIEFDNTAEFTNIILIPRGETRGEEPISIPVPPMFSYHFSNAFEDDDGTLAIDLIVAKTNPKQLSRIVGDDLNNSGYPTKPVWEILMDRISDVPAYELIRLRVDPVQGKMISKRSLSDECAMVEFPVINPKKVGEKYKYVYCTTSASARYTSPLQGIAKINVETGELVGKWLPEPHQFTTEVAFCPKETSCCSREDDGYLITYLLDGKSKSNQLIVFDAANPGKGPIASAPLKEWSVNHSLHGVFIPGFTPKFTKEIQDTF